MNKEDFVHYWARRISQNPPGTRERTVEGVRCRDDYDAEFDPRDTPQRREILERVRQEASRLHRECRPMGKAADRLRTINFADLEARVFAGSFITDEGTYLKPADLRPGKVNWEREHLGTWEPEFPYPDTTHSRFEFRPSRYGYGPMQRALDDLRAYGKKFNNVKWFIDGEGEKDMDKKIDWHKPLQARNPETGRLQTQKVYTYKSGKQRVIWVDDRVYPVDDNGRMAADVHYPGWGYRKVGEYVVENAPEEKFFVGLYWLLSTGEYRLTNGGVPVARDQVQLAEVRGCQWIVDTRQSADLTPAKHDPKDWTVVRECGYGGTESCGMMTKSKSDAVAGVNGGTAVRVRTTPPPADTARYIQLYRLTPGKGPWKIDGNAMNSPRQEYPASRLRKNGFMGNEYIHVKVRD